MATEDASKLLLLNIARLVSCAELLARKRKYGPAVHMMIAAHEECAKWIALFCWNHLEDRTKRRIYNHIFKHDLGGLFYYLTGRHQIARFVATGTKHLKGRDPKWDEAALIVSRHLFDETERYDARRLSVHINKILYGEDRTKTNKDLYEAHFRATERDRTGSIYVDFDKDLQVVLSPEKFGLCRYRDYKRKVLIARYYIDRLRGRRRSGTYLYRVNPRWEAEVKQFVSVLNKRLQRRQKQKGRVGTKASSH